MRRALHKGLLQVRRGKGIPRASFFRAFSGLSLAFTSASSSTSATYTATVEGSEGLTVELFLGGVFQGNMTESSSGIYELDVTLDSLSNDLTVKVGGVEYDALTVAFNAIVSPSFRGRFYNEGLTDISGNSVSVQNGSAAGADTNDTSAGENNERITDGNDYILIGACQKVSKIIVFYAPNTSSRNSGIGAIESESSAAWIYFGPVTGSLTDEIVTVVAGSSRSAWTSALGSVSIGWHVLQIDWDGSAYKITIDNDEKSIAEYELPVAPNASTSTLFCRNGAFDIFAVSGTRISECIYFASNQNANAADIYATLKLEHEAAGITLP